MATGQATQVDDWEDVSDWEDAGDWADVGPQIAPVPSTAELKSKHAANVTAGQAAYKPGWSETVRTQGVAGLGSELLKGAGEAITGTPSRIVGAISAVPEFAKQVLVNPTQAGVSAIQGITEPLISPRTTGEAVAGAGIDAALMGGAAKAVGAAAKLPTAWKTYQGAQVGNRFKAGLGIADTDVRALNAVDQSLGTLRGGTKAKVPFTNSESAAKFIKGHNDKFFKTHRAELAEINSSLPVEFMGEQTSLQNVSSEITRLNKRLHNYQSQDPKTRAIMEEVNPSLKADVERLHAARDVVNGAIDTVAPQSARQADIMRTYFNLKELEDLTSARAAQLKAARDIAKGSKVPVGQVLKDMIFNRTLLGAPGGGAQISARTLQVLKNRLSGPKVDPEVFFKIAGKKFKHVKAAEPITPAQRQIPSHTGPDPSGVIPMSQRGVGAQFEAVTEGMNQPGRPGQLALPAAESVQLPSEMNPPRPVRGLLPGQSQKLLPGGSQFDLEQPTYDVVPPSGGYYPEPIQVPQRGMPSNPNQLFEGDIRGGYRFRDPAQQTPQINPVPRRISALTPEQAAEEQIARRSGRFVERRKTIGEGANPSLADYHRYVRGEEGVGNFIDTMDRTLPAAKPAQSGFPLSKLRPGERGSIKIGPGHPQAEGIDFNRFDAVLNDRGEVTLTRKIRATEIPMLEQMGFNKFVEDAKQLITRNKGVPFSSQELEILRRGYMDRVSAGLDKDPLIAAGQVDISRWK